MSLGERTPGWGHLHPVDLWLLKWPLGATSRCCKVKPSLPPTSPWAVLCEALRHSPGSEAWSFSGQEQLSVNFLNSSAFLGGSKSMRKTFQRGMTGGGRKLATKNSWIESGFSSLCCLEFIFTGQLLRNSSCEYMISPSTGEKTGVFCHRKSNQTHSCAFGSFQSSAHVIRQLHNMQLFMGLV